MTTSLKDEIVVSGGPKGYCDSHPNSHKIIITHTDGKFNQEKSCKNWRLNNRML
jgi:hypothetical protein